MNAVLSFFNRLAFMIICHMTMSQAAEPLPKMNVNINQTSVSGLSSGGYMAVQFHIAHSAIVKGVGVFAGGPYYCAKNSLLNAISKCMQPKIESSLLNIDDLIFFTNGQSLKQTIDSIDNLKNARVWLFVGTRDTMVYPKVMDKLNDYYRHFVDHENIVYKNDIAAGHAMITADYGNDCGRSDTPYINNCGYDGAGELLQHIYGKLNPPAQQPQGSLEAFDQTEFFKDMSPQVSLAKVGYVYIPNACAQNSCRVHVFFHGCKQNAEQLKTELIDHAGFNRWADTNNFIILYPQTTKLYVLTNMPDKNNPYGCWDWYGFSGNDYYSKSAPQIKSVMGMLERLSEKL